MNTTPGADDGHAADEGGASREPRVHLPWWVLVAVLAVAIRLLPFGDAFSPDNRDFHGLFGAFATGGPATDLAQRGLLESGGMPYQWRVDLADGSTETRWYMHHPPAYMLISGAVLQWIGPYEDALRLPALLFSLFSIFAAHRFARAFAGERVARLAAFLMAVVPYSARDGMQVWTEAAIAGTTCFVIVYGVRWIDHRRPRDLVAAGAWLAAGALLDWPAHFVLPGLAVYAIVRCAKEGDWGRFLWAWSLPLLSGVLLAGHKLHMLAVASSEQAMADSSKTLAYVMDFGQYYGLPSFDASGLEWPLLGFLEIQLGFQRRGFTGPLLLVAVLGLVRASCVRDARRALIGWSVVVVALVAATASSVRLVHPLVLTAVALVGYGVLAARPSIVDRGTDASSGAASGPSRLRAALWIGLAPGLWYVFLFPGRSNNHDFFMLVSAPAVCLAAAIGLCAAADLVARRTGRVSLGTGFLSASVLAATLLCFLNVALQWVTHRSAELPRLAGQPWLAPVLTDEDAVVITHMSRGACLPFYARAPIVYGTDGIEAFDGFLEGLVDRMEPERRAVFLFDQTWGLTDPNMIPVLARLQQFDQAVEHVVDIGKGPESFWLVELPTGGALNGSGAPGGSVGANGATGANRAGEG